jgi:uncharacterized protein
MRLPVVLALAASLALRGQSQPTPPAQPSISIEEFEPKSTLVVPHRDVQRAKYPFIDVHTHHREFNAAALEKLEQEMDKLNMRAMVNSIVMGGAGAWVKSAATAANAFDRGRFAVMTNIADFKVDQPGYSERVAKQLEEDIRNGAVGLKVWKNFGMSEKDSQGRRIPVDDPRLDAVWEVCAKYKIPVLIHTADPKPLFEPMDKNNERWLELKMRPNRMNQELDWDQIIGEQHHLFERHPNTIFIAAHAGWLMSDTAKLGAMLDRCPNVYIEIGAIDSEIGRQPRTAKAFFTKYQDRVLFGKDRWDPAEYPAYFHLLETEDEYFPPIRKYHGLWYLYGLGLPDDVLKKIYYKNALRLYPSLSKAGYPD